MDWRREMERGAGREEIFTLSRVWRAGSGRSWGRRTSTPFHTNGALAHASTLRICSRVIRPQRLGARSSPIHRGQRSIGAGVRSQEYHGSISRIEAKARMQRALQPANVLGHVLAVVSLHTTSGMSCFLKLMGSHALDYLASLAR